MPLIYINTYELYSRITAEWLCNYRYTSARSISINIIHVPYSGVRGLYSPGPALSCRKKIICTENFSFDLRCINLGHEYSRRCFFKILGIRALEHEIQNGRLPTYGTCNFWTNTLRNMFNTNFPNDFVMITTFLGLFLYFDVPLVFKSNMAAFLHMVHVTF